MTTVQFVCEICQFFYFVDKYEVVQQKKLRF